jgi:DNA-binding IscR family transcriptional regulator
MWRSSSHAWSAFIPVTSLLLRKHRRFRKKQLGVTSASFVRRILAKLSKAGLVKTATGEGGACWLARRASDISLLEIYRAIRAPKAFAIHQYPIEKRCTVSCNIKSALGRVLNETQRAVEQRLSQIRLAQVIVDLRKNNRTGSRRKGHGSYCYFQRKVNPATDASLAGGFDFLDYYFGRRMKWLRKSYDWRRTQENV